MNKRQEIAEKVVSTLLTGKCVYREDINNLGEDANYVIDYIRNNRLIPVECNKGCAGADPYWFMSSDNIDLYRSNRSEQIAKQKKIVTLGQRKRQLKNTEQLFKSLDIPIPPQLQDVIKNTFTNASR